MFQILILRCNTNTLSKKEQKVTSKKRNVLLLIQMRYISSCYHKYLQKNVYQQCIYFISSFITLINSNNNKNISLICIGYNHVYNHDR